jgi:hypothetical protein
MKNIFVLVLMISAVFSSYSQSLKNGSFEDGLSFWSINGNSSCKLEVILEDSSNYGIIKPMEGNKFLKITNDTSLYLPCNIVNGFKITPQIIKGFDFSFGGLIHSNDTDISYNFRINFFSGSNSYLFGYINGFTNAKTNRIFGKGINADSSTIKFKELIDSVQIAFNVSYEQSKSFNWYLDDVMLNFKTTSINNTLSNDLNVYPNPTNGVINIEGNQQYTYNLFDAKGNCLKANANLEYNVIDISMLSAGLFFLELTDDQGQVIRKKIIKN